MQHSGIEDLTTFEEENWQIRVSSHYCNRVKSKILYACRIERAFPVQEHQSKEDTPTIQTNPLDEKAVKQKMSKNQPIRYISPYAIFVTFYHSDVSVIAYITLVHVCAMTQDAK